MWDSRLGEIKQVDLHVPNIPELIQVIHDGLKQHFKEVTVEWILCPDMKQQPFNLAAPGICGSPILMELGCMTYLFPRPYKNMYSMKKVLDTICTDRRIMSIIGASVSPRQSNAQLGELVMNASILRMSSNLMEIKNQSCLAYEDEQTKNCALEPVNDVNLKCYPYGSFLISKGSREYVLKILTKKRISNTSFLEALQSSLDNKYSDEESKRLVGLGGTFVVRNARVKQHVLPYSWDASLYSAADVRKWLHYFELNTPIVAMGTLVSSSDVYANICEATFGKRYDIPKSRFHAYSSDGIGGFFYKDVESYDVTEYLGYFCPANVLYHIDPSVKNNNLQNFADMWKR